MQANLERGKAVFGIRNVCRSAAILAGVPLIAALALCAPDRALAACGTIATGGVAHAPPSGGGSVHSGATAPHVSSGGGGSSCAAGAGGKGIQTGTITGGKLAALEGVHTWTHNTGNGTTHNTGNGTHTRVANASTRAHILRH
jgi:hypothetical protein